MRRVILYGLFFTNGILLADVRRPLASANYCLAIRGNGQLMPAHWGGIAQTIESYGLPTGVAGGSSGAISSFLLESILINPVVASARGAQQILFTSYLVKSLQGFTVQLADKPEWKALRDFVDTISVQGTKPLLLENLARALATQTSTTVGAASQLRQALDELARSQIFDGPGIQNLRKNLAAVLGQNRPGDVALQNLKNSINEVQESLSVFGKFDARTDRALFLRDGIVNFKALAHLFGRMAAFYSQSGFGMADHLNQCATDSTVGKTWAELAPSSCAKDFGEMIDRFFSSEAGRLSTRIFEPVGQKFPTLVTTSVLLEPSKDALEEPKT